MKTLVILIGAVLLYCLPVFNAHAAITFLGSASSTNNASSAPLNTTGATLLIANVAWYNTYPATGTVSDNCGNTWNYLTISSSSNGTQMEQMAYSYGKGGGSLCTSSNDQISITNSYAAQSVSWSAFSGTLTGSSPFDSLARINKYPSGPVTVGPVSPSQANDLFFAGDSEESITTTTVSSPFIYEQYVRGGARTASPSGNTTAYYVQTIASATSATFTYTNNDNMALSLVAFKAAPSPVGIPDIPFFIVKAAQFIVHAVQFIIK